MRAKKIVAETGLLVLAASGVPDEEAAAAAAELAKRLVPYARSDRMLMGVALEPAAAWDYSQAHVFLTRLGTPDADFDGCCAKATPHNQRRAGNAYPIGCSSAIG